MKRYLIPLALLVGLSGCATLDDYYDGYGYNGYGYGYGSSDYGRYDRYDRDNRRYDRRHRYDRRDRRYRGERYRRDRDGDRHNWRNRPGD